jgi:hypothetical protein
LPWLPFYAHEQDFELILAKLNGDPEIAFIISVGPGRWTAQEQLDTFEQRKYALWHVPSGPLPFLSRKWYRIRRVIKNPWQGWTEEFSGVDPSIPLFGPDHPGIIWLDLRWQGWFDADAIGLSGFSWIGNRYRFMGKGAKPATELWWKRLRRWVRTVARQIPRFGPWEGPDREVWAFPSALDSIMRGVPRAAD